MAREITFANRVESLKQFKYLYNCSKILKVVLKNRKSVSLSETSGFIGYTALIYEWAYKETGRRSPRTAHLRPRKTTGDSINGIDYTPARLPGSA